MHKKWLIALIMLPSQAVLGQSQIPNSFSLVPYAPRLVAQKSPNCFSYATAHIALTTQIAFRNGIMNPDSAQSFSLGFVDGIIADLGRKKVLQAAIDRWGGDPGDYNNLDNAFLILITYGTVPFSEFPYVDEKSSAKYYRKNKSVWKSKPTTKIKDRIELVKPADLKDETTIKNLTSYLGRGIPIICAINQGEAVCNVEFAGDAAWGDNHIVTLMGYDSDKRLFIVRNNYDCCNCNIEIDYQRFLRALRWAYVLELQDSN